MSTMIAKLLAVLSLFAILGTEAHVTKVALSDSDPSLPVEVAPGDIGVIVEADPTMSAHYRVGEYAVISKSGDWVTEQVGNSIVSRPMSLNAGLLMQDPDGGLIWHWVQPSGECVESCHWIAVRPGSQIGAACDSPWSIGGGEESSASPALALCSPYNYDAPRFEVISMTFSGDCWITASNGACDVKKECRQSSGTSCTLDGKLLGDGWFSETSECGGDLTVQFYCQGGQNRIRICN